MSEENKPIEEPQMARDITRLEGKVDDLTAETKSLRQELVGFNGRGGLLDRIQKIEDKVEEMWILRWKVAGIATAFGVASSILGSVISKKLLQ